MQETPAVLRNAAARRLMARGRFREALDVLNEAIRIDPRYAESFDNRAAVFERLGMYPQADADRRKVAELGGVRRPPPPAPDDRRRGFERRGPPDRAPQPATPSPTEPEPDVVADVVASAELTPEPEPIVVAFDRPSITEEPETEVPPAADELTEELVEASTPSHGRRRVAAPRYPGRPPTGGAGGAAAARSLGTLLITMGLLTAAGIGIYLALMSIGDALNSDNGPASPGGDGDSPTPTVSGGASGTPTDTPEDIDEALGGDPLSFSRFSAAWDAKGITATPGEAADGLRGFGTTPVAVSLTRGGATEEIALLFYDSPAGPAADFDLNPTSVTPKAGRTIPSGAVVWYNANVVAIILSPNDGVHADARDAFFAVSA